MNRYQYILDLINNKDPNGLKELFDSFGKKFYGYAVSKWNFSKDEAWDVVYKTLETLVLKLPNYEFKSEAHFKNFLYKVFVNFLRQQFRSQRNKQIEIEHLDFNSDVSEDKDGNASDNLHFKIDKQTYNDYYRAEIIESPKLVALNIALEKLQTEEKDILLLRAQGFSYEEVAGLLSIDNKQLKVKHLRAKNKLIKLLEETIKNQSNGKSE